MKAAFSIWDNRIAPVFDVARHILIVEAKSGNVLSETPDILPEYMSVRKAVCLSELGIDILICGAISRPLRDIVASYDIRVISFVAGDLRQVMDAWLSRSGDIRLFAMPGCCGNRKGRWKSERANGTESIVRGENRGGTGQGCRSGGGVAGPPDADSGRYSFCPQCGFDAPHHHRVSCARKECPKCGSTMQRQ